MNGHRAAPVDRLRPIWGFTWRGWALLTIALALGAVLATGYDPRYRFLSLVNDLVGWPGLSFWWVYIHFPLYQTTVRAVPEPGLGILQMCLLLVALHLHPRVGSRWTVAAVCLWGVAGQPLRFYLCDFLPPTVDEYALSGIPYFVVSALLLLWATRSWLVFAVFALLGTANIVMLFLFSASTTLPPILFDWPGSLLWNLAYLAALIAWAIPAHRRAAARLACSVPCPRCDYDLAGLDAAAPCPECGAARA